MKAINPGEYPILIMSFATCCLVLACACAVIIGVARLLQHRLAFHPDDRHPTPSLGITGLKIIPAGMPSGLAAMAWHVPASPGLPTVVFLHGNAGNIGDRENRIAAFAQAGIGILMVEYPGYGGEAGKPGERRLLEAGRRALDFLDRSGLPSSRVILYGESIGTAIATRLATEREVGGLILESPYTSILDIARQIVPWLPVRLLFLERFEQLSLIAMVHAPLLILQGALDQIIPSAMGRAVFEAANHPKRLWTTPEAGHNDLADFGAIAEAILFVRNDTLVSLSGRNAGAI